MLTASALRDSDIRRALLAHLARDPAAAPRKVIEELGLCRGQVRADIVVVGDELHAYEIKSDRDTLARLERQAEVYGLTMDRVTLVVTRRHLEEAKSVVPRWWGILRADEGREGLSFSTVRRGRRNGHRDPRALVELPWLSDALQLLEARGITRGLKGRPRRVIWDRICQEVALDEVATAVRAQLLGRSGPCHAAAGLPVALSVVSRDRMPRTAV